MVFTCIYCFSFFWFFSLHEAFLYFRNALEVNFTKTQMYEKRLSHAINCAKMLRSPFKRNPHLIYELLPDPFQIFYDNLPSQTVVLSSLHVKKPRI
jgi:hypothetical protein